MANMQISFSDIINATENQLLRCTLNFHSCLNQQIKIKLKQGKKRENKDVKCDILYRLLSINGSLSFIKNSFFVKPFEL